MNNTDNQTSQNYFINSTEIDSFKEKTDQLMSNLENNDITSALNCIHEINEMNGKNFYSIIGKLTRGLHDAISDLSLSSAENQPQNNKIRVDLNYVIDVTNDAAQKTLDMTEQAMGSINQLKTNSDQKANLLNELLAECGSNEKAIAIINDLATLNETNLEHINQAKSNISEIIMAQNFQDIASQTITKAIAIIKGVGNSLVNLTQYATLLSKLSHFSDADQSEIEASESEALKSDIGQIKNINESEHLDQGDVDDLLSSLGF